MRSIAIALTRAAAAFSITLATAAPVDATDWSANAFAPPDSVGGCHRHVRSDGRTQFEGHVAGFNARPQVVNWKAEHFT